MAPPRVRRVFFALWPDWPAGEAINRWTRTNDISGRIVPVDGLHLTLAFIGNCNAGDLARCVQRAQAIRCSAFAITLNRVGYFRRPGIVWLGPDQTPGALDQLAATLTPEGLENGRFRPHVSVARNAHPVAPAAVAPITWRARRFALIESGANGRPGDYHTLDSWPLIEAGRP